MGRSISPMREETVTGSDPRAAPRLIVPMSLQLVIPWRVALQQSSPPLHQLSAILKEKRKFEKEKPLNCMCANSKLSQQRGSPQSFVLIVCPSPALSRRLLCCFPLVVLQQAPQSFSTPHCSHVPSCLRARRKQDPIVFALMVALLVVMYDILLQRSPQRRFSKQDQPRQTFFFDRPHPAFRVRVQIRASCWQSKRIHASRLDQFPK